jgi:hypothetical protein
VRAVDGFAVDLDAVTGAAEGIESVARRLAAQPVAGLDSPTAAGHDRLAASLATFCDRWNVGVGQLAADAAEIGRRLREVAAAYADVEHRVSGVLASAAPDPGDP